MVLQSHCRANPWRKPDVHLEVALLQLARDRKLLQLRVPGLLLRSVCGRSAVYGIGRALIEHQLPVAELGPDATQRDCSLQLDNPSCVHGIA